MNADGMADEAVVPSTRVNKAATAVAESAEERDLTEGKYCRIGVDASDSEPEQVSIGASREITTGSVTVCRDRLTQRRSRMSQGSRTDLCGGRLATAVPTAILENLRRTLRSDEPSLVGKNDSTDVISVFSTAQIISGIFRNLYSGEGFLSSIVGSSVNRCSSHFLRFQDVGTAKFETSIHTR